MHSPYLPQISFFVLNELCLKNTIYLPEPVMNELKVMNELSLFKESTSGPNVTRHIMALSYKCSPHKAKAGQFVPCKFIITPGCKFQSKSVFFLNLGIGFEMMKSIDQKTPFLTKTHFLTQKPDKTFFFGCSQIRGTACHSLFNLDQQKRRK